VAATSNKQTNKLQRTVLGCGRRFFRSLLPGFCMLGAHIPAARWTCAGAHAQHTRSRCVTKWWEIGSFNTHNSESGHV